MGMHENPSNLSLGIKDLWKCAFDYSCTRIHVLELQKK